MDPVSILGIASAVVGFVQFGQSLLSDARKCLQRTDDAYEIQAQLTALRNQAGQLSTVLGNIQKSYGFPQLPPGADPGEPQPVPELVDAIIKLNDRCTKTHNGLLELSAKILESKKAKMPRWLQQTISSMSASPATYGSDDRAVPSSLEKRMSELQGQLEGIRKETMVICTGLLWRNSEDIKLALNKISMRQNRLVSLVDGINARVLAIVESMWPTVPPVKGGAEFSSPCGKILHTLYFPAMKHRELEIPDASKRTFEWIIQHPNGGVNTPGVGGKATWSDFPAWLKGDSGNLYWITGKPGSGKSTLVKYLMGPKRQELETLLVEWAGSQTLYVASFYSWNAGSSVEQRSVKGLLKTLLHQLLEAAPDLTPLVCPRHWAMLKLFGTGGDVTLEDWSEEQLRDALMVFITRSGRKQNRVTIFIDGLDEFDTGDHLTLVQLVQRLCNSFPTELKVCITSRPWTLFSNAFGSQPSLRMEDLTEADMRIHVQQGFQNNLGLRELEKRYGATAMEELVHSLVTKAQGVFLWVAVVTLNLSGAMVAGDSMPELQAILNRLPEQLESLYQQIWDRLDDRNKCETAKYIEIIEESEDTLDVSTMFAAEQPDPYESAKLPMELQRQQLNRRLLTKSRGLLEITGAGLISYHHRSLTEWVWANHSDIQSKLPPNFDAHLCLAVAKVALLLAGHRDDPTDSGFMDNLESCLRYASMVPDREPFATKLVEALDMFPASGLNSFPQFGYMSANILSLAAQFVVTPYVRKKVEAEPKLVQVVNREHVYTLQVGPLLEHALCIPGRKIGSFSPGDSNTCCFVSLKERVAMVKFLLEHGADPRVPSYILHDLAPQTFKYKRRYHMFEKRHDIPSLREKMQHIESAVPRYSPWFVTAVGDLLERHERVLYEKEHPWRARVRRMGKSCWR